MPPAHVVRLGTQLDIKGLLGGTDDSDRAVRYLTKYLTKSIADTYADRRRTRPRATRRTSTGCTPRSWCCRARRRARTGSATASSPRTPAPGWSPAGARPRPTTGSTSASAAAGSWSPAAWSGKTLTEHRADRAAVVRQVLEAAGIDPPEARRKAADVLHTDGQPRYVWEDVPPAERDYAAVIVASIAEQRRWRAEHEHAKALAAQRGSPPGEPVDNRSATRSGPTGHRGRAGSMSGGQSVDRLLSVDEVAEATRDDGPVPATPHCRAAHPVRPRRTARADTSLGAR